MNKRGSSSTGNLKIEQEDSDVKIKDDDSNCFSETIALQTNESVIGVGPPELDSSRSQTSLPNSYTQIDKIEYYKRPNENIGLSLYRDHVNRQKRSKVAVLATDLKAKI